MGVVIGALALASWIYLAFGHGRFWRGDQRLPQALTEPASWPRVAVVVPARNESAVLERALRSLLEQDYPGPLAVFAVDDQSEDDTRAIAEELAASHPAGGRLGVLTTATRPSGWVGKMWAVHTGVEAAKADAPVYVLLTDADVEHSPGNLRRLVAKAEAGAFGAVSLMVRLHCVSAWERLLVPAFVYFFQQLYPFPRINDPASRIAGAAGGCLLVRSETLELAGGIAAVRGEIIDDCAIGAILKHEAPIWVGLTASESSFRPYEGLGDLWDMVARSAYTQLRYSPWLLAGTVLGLALVYLAAPLLVLTAPCHGDAGATGFAALAWALMTWTYLPTIRAYGQPSWRALLLPVAGAFYLGMTLDSARRHAQGRGAEWKGRAQAGRGSD